MSKRMTKLLLVASALVLGACSADSDITAPAGGAAVDVRYDVQVDAKEPSQQDIAKNARWKRYAMAAS